MALRVIFLGRLADAAGTEASELVSTGGELDWSGLLAVLDGQVRQGLAAAADDPRVKLAVNGVVLADRAALAARDGDEIALLPPVSGG